MRGSRTAVASALSALVVASAFAPQGVALAAVGTAAAATAADAAKARTAADAPSERAAPAVPRLVLDAHPLVGRVWDVRGRRDVEPARVEAAVERARFVLLGERHGNPEHHRLQARLIAAAARERRPAIVLEQLDFPVQPAIDACREQCDDFGAELGERVEWKRSGWPAYALYRPIFDVAARSALAVVAGNPGARRVRALARGESPQPEETAWLAAADRPVPASGRERLVDDLVDGHCGQLPRERAAPMVRAQRVRDAALAATLERSAVEQGAAVLVAGAGHVRRDYGVPTLLAPDAPAVVVGFLEVAAERDDPDDYGPLDGYDYVWFTPRVDEPDPCARLRLPQ